MLLGSVLASSDINEPTGVPWFITGDAALRTFKSLETIPFQKGGSAAERNICLLVKCFLIFVGDF